MTWRVPIGLSVAIAVYVALRALILATSFESVALPMYELYPMGTMAELRLRGIDFPLHYFYDNAAGQILMGFLTVPVFAVFGSSYLALKLLPATLGLATLILVWKLLDRHFGRRAANIAAFLFAVGPPTLTKYSLINSGNHFENLAFTMLAIVLAYRWFAGAAKSRGGLFAYALACGFALFVFLGALIPVGILFGMHLGIRGLRRTLRDAPVLVGGFALGIAPLVIVNAVTSARGMGFLDAKFGNENSGRGADVLARTVDFLGQRLFEAPVFEPFAGLSRPVLSGLFLAAFALAWFVSLPSIAASVVAFARGLVAPPRSASDEIATFGRAKLVPFVIYVPLAALAYGISNFRLGGHSAPVEIAGFRYYLPTLLCALILIAVWSQRWIERGTFDRLGAYVLLTAAAIPCASSLAIVDWTLSKPNVGSQLNGYNLAQMARALLSERNAVSREETISRVDALPSEVPRVPVITALGFNLGVRTVDGAQRAGGPDWRVDSAQFLAPWPRDWHPHLMRGLGHAIRWRLHMANKPVDGVTDAAARVTEPGADLSLELWDGLASPGVMLPMPWESGRILDENDDLLGRSGSTIPGFARGHGILCERLRWRRIRYEVERCELSATLARSRPYERDWQAGVGAGTFRTW